MKNLKKVLATTLTATLVLSVTACGSSQEEAKTDEKTSGATAETTDTEEKSSGNQEIIELTLWGAEEDQALLAELVEGFKSTYPDQNFDIQIGVESESTAKDTILTDVEAAADVYSFASDQLTDLVKAGALLNLEEYGEVLQMAGKTLDDVKSANSAGSVEAASIDGSMYAFPRAGDNGYFLYYDASVLSEEDVTSWDNLLASADAAGKKVGMTLASGWYNASFFYGAGFTTDLNDDGTTFIDWNGTSADGYTGVDVVKGMMEIASSPAFMAIADGDGSNQLASGALVACVSGTWDAITAQEVFGDGYAATKLPTFSVGDKEVQQGSVAGFKFTGVNGYAENAGWAVLLADYITNEEAQQKFFDQRESGPTNNKIIESDSVKANVAIAALAEQSEFSKTQMVGGKYWDPAQTFGELIAQGTLSPDDDAAIQSALDTLVEGISAPVE
ncbi:MAG: extracellular solute-binding protein [Blautia sp.]